MARNSRSKNRNNSYRPNFWGFLQNVLIAGLNKGQLLGMAVAIILIIMVLKYPSDEIPELFDKIFYISKVNSILGWIISVLVTFVGYFVIRWQRRIHTREIKRISFEKRNLQKQLSEVSLPSSNN